jgi:hypothetical protein
MAAVTFAEAARRLLHLLGLVVERRGQMVEHHAALGLQAEDAKRHSARRADFFFRQLVGVFLSSDPSTHVVHHSTYEMSNHHGVAKRRT